MKTPEVIKLLTESAPRTRKSMAKDVRENVGLELPATAFELSYIVNWQVLKKYYVLRMKNGSSEVKAPRTIRYRVM